jgi:outer membrane protein
MKAEIRKICPLLFIVIMFLAGNAHAQQTQAFSLQQAVDYALKHNYMILNSLADVDIARNRVREITSLGFPQVQGEANIQNFINIPTQVIPANAFNPMADPNELVPVRFGTNYNAAASINASQLIFDGSYIVGLQSSKTYLQLSRLQLGKAENDIRAEVTRSYYTVLIALENIKILRNNLQNAENLLKETEETYKAGFVEESDVDQLNILTLNLKNAISRGERQRDLAEKLLKFQMGIEIDKAIELTEKTDRIIAEIDIEKLSEGKDYNVEEHVELRLAKTNSDFMKLNLRNERFKYLPSLNAFISHSENAFRNDFNFFTNRPWYPATVWGVSLRVPVFDSGIKHFRIKQANFEYEKSITMQKMAEQSLKLQVQNSGADLVSAFERLNAEKQNLVFAEKIQNKTMIKYKEGLASSLELNQAQNQFLSTQGNYINSVFEVLNAKIQFEKATNIKQ